jgi:hypothetical protein
MARGFAARCAANFPRVSLLLLYGSMQGCSWETGMEVPSV